MLAMAVNNELDAIWIMSRSTYEIARQRNPDIVAWTDELPYAYLDACPRMLTFNNLKVPFDDKVVRHAINDDEDPVEGRRIARCSTPPPSSRRSRSVWRWPI